jgi:hypothetical protein
MPSESRQAGLKAKSPATPKMAGKSLPQETKYNEADLIKKRIAILEKNQAGNREQEQEIGMYLSI